MPSGIIHYTERTASHLSKPFSGLSAVMKSRGGPVISPLFRRTGPEGLRPEQEKAAPPCDKGQLLTRGLLLFRLGRGPETFASRIRRRENGGSIVVSARFSQKRRVSSAMAPTRCFP